MITVIHLMYKHPDVKRSRSKEIGILCVHSQEGDITGVQRSWEEYCEKYKLRENFNPESDECEIFIEEFMDDFNSDPNNSHFYIEPVEFAYLIV